MFGSPEILYWFVVCSPARGKNENHLTSSKGRVLLGRQQHFIISLCFLEFPGPSFGAAALSCDHRLTKTHSGSHLRPRMTARILRLWIRWCQSRDSQSLAYRNCSLTLDGCSMAKLLWVVDYYRELGFFGPRVAYYSTLGQDLGKDSLPSSL